MLLACTQEENNRNNTCSMLRAGSMPPVAATTVDIARYISSVSSVFACFLLHSVYALFYACFLLRAVPAFSLLSFYAHLLLLTASATEVGVVVQQPPSSVAEAVLHRPSCRTNHSAKLLTQHPCLTIDPATCNVLQ